MTTRTAAPAGAPCWADLWTSDVEGSRRFYAELFGWEAQAPSPEFGGYFMFTRTGVPVAGGMGDMGDMPANDTWKVYLSVSDVEATASAIAAAGGQVVSPPMPVADLGTQCVLTDAGGATLGVWEPGAFPGFTLLGEPGTPAWFELHTADYEGAVAFYESAFGWTTKPMDGAPDFRYATLHDNGTDEDLAGILDASGFLGGATPAWYVYWTVADVDAAAARVKELGGTVVADPETTPFGRIASATDPAGAAFKLHAWV